MQDEKDRHKKQPLSVHTMKPLGTQLVEAGYLTHAQLQHALAFQKSNPDKLLGQVLTETGLLTEAQFQDFMLSRISIQQPLGELLVNLGYLSRDQLTHMLAIQMQMIPAPKPLGQLLIEHGLITPETLENILARQREQQDASWYDWDNTFWAGLLLWLSVLLVPCAAIKPSRFPRKLTGNMFVQ